MILTANNGWISQYVTDDSYLIYTIIFALFVVPMSYNKDDDLDDYYY